MICQPCRDKLHDACPGGTWCDCQCITEGVNVNRELISRLERERNRADEGA